MGFQRKDVSGIHQGVRIERGDDERRSDTNDRTVGGHLARKQWRLGGVGTASRIVQQKTDAGAHIEVT